MNRADKNSHKNPRVLGGISLFILLFVVQLLVTSHFAQAAEFKDGVTHISQAEFMEKVKQPNVVVIDVRTKREYVRGHIEGAINHPHRAILKDSSVLDQYAGKDIIFYCHTGVRVKIVTDYVRGSKIEEARLFHLKGDMRAWRARNLPRKTGEQP